MKHNCTNDGEFEGWQTNSNNEGLEPRLHSGQEPRRKYKHPRQHHDHKE